LIKYVHYKGSLLPLFRLNQWFLIGGRTLRGVSVNFQGGASPYAPYNMESLIIKFTNKYICFYRLFKVRRTWNKGQILKGGVIKKRLRTTGLNQWFPNCGTRTASVAWSL